MALHSCHSCHGSRVYWGMRCDFPHGEAFILLQYSSVLKLRGYVCHAQLSKHSFLSGFTTYFCTLVQLGLVQSPLDGHTCMPVSVYACTCSTCVCTCMCVCGTCVCTLCVCVWYVLCTCMCVHVCSTCVHLYVCAYVWYVCMSVRVMNVRLYVYVGACACVCVSVCAFYHNNLLFILSQVQSQTVE